MTPIRERLGRLPTLADRFSSRRNSIGLIRLTLALGVLVAHSWPLGYGLDDLGTDFTHRQTNVGQISVYGFFVLSGFLITGSGMRFTIGRFAWHRFLRIFPGFWVCLLVTALVFAPLVAIYERGTLAGFFTHPAGPFDFLVGNWFTAMRQHPISGLLTETPYGERVGGPSAFNGSLWSLRYELICYILVGALAVTAVLRKAPRAVFLLFAIFYLIIVRDFSNAADVFSRPPARGTAGPYPLIGGFSLDSLIYLTFMFLCGAAARVYQHRLPMHGAIASVAAVGLLGSMWQGGFIIIGMPAFAYLLLYVSVALPSWTHSIGRDRDYSYGIYIYAFPVQQSISLLGGNQWGVAVYILLSAAGTMLLAIPSWHLIERPVMKLKDYEPGFVRRMRDGTAPATDPPVAAAQPGPAAAEPALAKPAPAAVPAP